MHPTWCKITSPTAAGKLCGSPMRESETQQHLGITVSTGLTSRTPKGHRKSQGQTWRRHAAYKQQTVETRILPDKNNRGHHLMILYPFGRKLTTLGNWTETTVSLCWHRGALLLRGSPGSSSAPTTPQAWPLQAPSSNTKPARTLAFQQGFFPLQPPLSVCFLFPLQPGKNDNLQSHAIY